MLSKRQYVHSPLLGILFTQPPILELSLKECLTMEPIHTYSLERGGKQLIPTTQLFGPPQSQGMNLQTLATLYPGKTINQSTLIS